jgi:hypothetical protein
MTHKPKEYFPEFSEKHLEHVRSLNYTKCAQQFDLMRNQHAQSNTLAGLPKKDRASSENKKECVDELLQTLRSK